MEDKEAFKCNNCGSNTYRQIDSKTVECEYCHTKYRIKTKSPSISVEVGKAKGTVDFGDVKDKVVSYFEEDTLRTQKIIYGACGICFGTFGVQDLLVGNNAGFVCSIIFCWTGIPSIVGVVKGIMALVGDSKSFEKKVNKKKSSWLYRYGEKRRPKVDTINNENNKIS